MSNDKWNKYTYVCGDCDALTEVTTVKDLKEYRGWCSCGSAQLLWLSVEDATIHPQTTKGNDMEAPYGAHEYNPNILVTYKKIEDGNTSYVTDKVTQIEWDLDQYRRVSSNYYTLSNKIDSLTEQIVEWHNPNYDKEEVLQGLCEIFGINPTKTVRVEAQVNVTVDIEVPLAELEDFDASYFLSDSLVIDSNDHTACVETWDVEHINWDVQ